MSENLTLLQQAQNHAAKQALDAVESGQPASLRAEVTTDGAVEGSASGSFKGGRLTGYVRWAFAGVKDFVAGVRFTKTLK